MSASRTAKPDDTAFGVYVDGSEKGAKIRVCTNSECAVHELIAAEVVRYIS